MYEKQSYNSHMKTMDFDETLRSNIFLTSLLCSTAASPSAMIYLAFSFSYTLHFTFISLTFCLSVFCCTFAYHIQRENYIKFHRYVSVIYILFTPYCRVQFCTPKLAKKHSQNIVDSNVDTSTK